jgi:glycosyltransferase involved in cell wall biosynthesis
MPHMTEIPIGDRETPSKENVAPRDSRAARPKRILYVHSSADIYGASRSLLRLTGALDRNRFEPFVVLPEDGMLKTRLEALGVPTSIEPSLAIISRYERLAATVLHRLPISTIRLLRLIRSLGIDLVHTNSGVIISAAIAAKLAGVPHVWHVRESFEEFRGWRWKFYSAFMRGFAERILCVSHATAAQFSGSPKAIVIHNGFSLGEFSVDANALGREFRQHFNIADNALVIGCIGRIKLKRKGQEYLVQAMHLLKQRAIRVKGLIVGAPYRGNESHLGELKALVRRLDLDEDMTFVGELADPKPAYAAMNIFVLPSAQPEPFGGVVMEAMAMGLPVIATNIGGSLDQVADGTTGFLVPPADPEALAEKLAQLASNPALRDQMGWAGRERIRTNFSLEEMVRRMESVYDSAL